MEIWFQKLIDVTAVARTREMFNEALTELARELGFEYYAYLNLQPVGTFAVSNYSPEWQDRYFSKSFSEIDPVVLIAKSTMRAFTWSSENTRKVRSRRVRQFYLDAAGFGIRSGITIPVATAFRRMAMRDCQEFCAVGRFHQLKNRSPKMTANCVFASTHS
ncbi:autoinducer binding domain-containing protein, partial [Sinorhizobium meliloti]|uniref:autoinducer binding domain-containing protein n=1 Tax=Rhizobium meliloti TaxID=382 RepID=UPI001F28AC8D